TIFSTRRSDIKQTHAFKLLAPRVSPFEITERATSDKIAATIRHFQRQALVTIEQHPVISCDAREALQIGNYHDRKFESLRLVNRHQTHRVRRLIDLAFTLATANRFKLFDV